MKFKPWLPVSYTITGQIISLVFAGKPPYSMRKNTVNETLGKRFDELKTRIQIAIKTGDAEEWEAIKALFITKNMVLQHIQDTKPVSNDVTPLDEITFKDGNYFFRGYKLSNYLLTRIEELVLQAEENDVDAKIALKPLTNFLRNLMDNPSSDSVKQLYRFVEHTKLPLTEDGYILAYKIITHDYKDKYSKSIDNSVGTTVSMARSLVDDNPDHTCSSGLHFCSWGYATGFFNNYSTDRMVVIKINPADVVSIPTDYGNEKGRCCKYTVLYEIPMERVLNEDVLGIGSNT